MQRRTLLLSRVNAWLERSFGRYRLLVVGMVAFVVLTVTVLFVRANLLSPERVIERVLAASNGQSDWGTLYRDIDVDDLQRNKWDQTGFEEFAMAIWRNVPAGTVFTAQEQLPQTSAENSDVPQAPLWNRRNRRIFNAMSVRPDGEEHVFTFELRRGLDHRWKIRTGEIINGVNWSAYPHKPIERARSYIDALKQAGMTEFWIVRPDLRVSLNDLEDFVSGERTEPAGFFPAE